MLNPSASRALPCAGVTATIAVALLCVWPALSGLSTLWLDTDRPGYAHGYLLAALSCFLLWKRRLRIAAAFADNDSRAFRVIGAACLLVSVLSWQIAYRAGIQLIYLMLVPPLLTAALWTTFGLAVGRVCAFPISLLYFAMPFWDYIIPLPQWGTVFAVRLMMMGTGIPVRFSGNLVQIPDGAFEVQGGCSGLHFIIVALTVAAVLGELRGDELRGRLRLIWLALGLALLTNWVRVFTIIMAGHFTHMQSYLVRVSHYGYGWVLFAIALCAFFMIERRLPVPSSVPEPREGVEQPDSAVVRRTLPWAACAIALLTLPMVLNALIDANSAAKITSFTPIGSGWQSTTGALTGWQPLQRLADAETRELWRRDDMQVDRYQATYFSQGERKKLGGQENRVEGDGKILATGIETTGRAGSFQSAGMVIDGAESVLWYQYIVGDRRFTSASRAQLWYSVASLLSLRSIPSRIVAVRAECRPDCTAARRTLRAFVGSGSQHAT